jgi:predicted enzyme related to lactoylglutathione lyase
MTMQMIVAACGVVAILLQTGMSGPQKPAIGYRPEVTLQIAVADLDRSIRFYEDVMGFKVSERRDDLQFAHLQTNVPGLELGINQVAPVVPPSAAVVINISVADVAAARAALEARGVKFPKPTQVIPGKVALAEFADPDGHRLRLAGPSVPNSRKPPNVLIAPVADVGRDAANSGTPTAWQ